VLLTMIWKDLLVILKDRKSLIITLCMPAVLTTILGFAFSGMMSGGFSIDRANIAVVSLGSREQDIERIKEFLDGPNMEGRLSVGQREDLLELLGDMDFENILYEDVLGSPEVGEFIQYERMELDRARSMLETGELAAVVVIPEGFTYDTFMNLALPFRNPITIEVIKHPDHSIKGEMVSGIVKGFTDALSAGIIAKNVLLSVFLAVAVGGLSVLLSAINLRLKNSKASTIFQAVVIQIFALLGGSFFPVAGIPVMQRLGGLTINGAAMQGFLKLMMGYGPEELIGTLITLTGIALVLFAIGAFVAAEAREV